MGLPRYHLINLDLNKYPMHLIQIHQLEDKSRKGETDLIEKLYESAYQLKNVRILATSAATASRPGAIYLRGSTNFGFCSSDSRISWVKTLFR